MTAPPHNFGTLQIVTQALAHRWREDPNYPGSRAMVFRGLLGCGHQVARGEPISKGQYVRCYRCV